MAEEHNPERRRRKSAGTRIRTSDAVLGAVLVVLSACGIIGIVRQVRMLAKRLREPDARIAAVTECLLPFALADTPAFAAPEELSDSDFLTLAAWTMISGGSLSDYPETDGLRIVPEDDLIAAGNARLGTERKPECKTIGFTDKIRFYYDEPKKSFMLPDAPMWFGPQPVITEVRPENGTFTVKADYMPELPAWSALQPEAAASAVFTVCESDGAWQVSALQFSDAPDTAPETTPQNDSASLQKNRT